MSHSEIIPNRSEADHIFFDDFNQGELDREKWNVMVTEKIYNNEQQAYIDSPETIYVVAGDQIPGSSDGALIIHPCYRPGFETADGKTFDFISGRIDTREKFDFRYGTASARIMLPSGSGLWPAFWMLGYGNWPSSGEIDIMEYTGEQDWVSAALHGPGYFGEAGLVNKYFFSTQEDATTWHVYSAEWSLDEVIFKVDDRTIYRVTRPMTDFFGPWVFNNKKYLILNFALGGTYPFKTNGVRTPYYGIPEETVQKIEEDQVKLAIDWIRVTGSESSGES
jgi:beta-glucanase (GH16 family)